MYRTKTFIIYILIFSCSILALISLTSIMLYIFSCSKEHIKRTYADHIEYIYIRHTISTLSLPKLLLTNSLSPLLSLSLPLQALSSLPARTAPHQSPRRSPTRTSAPIAKHRQRSPATTRATAALRTRTHSPWAMHCTPCTAVALLVQLAPTQRRMRCTTITTTILTTITTTTTA